MSWPESPGDVVIVVAVLLAYGAGIGNAMHEAMVRRSENKRHVEAHGEPLFTRAGGKVCLSRAPLRILWEEP